ncbi:metal binding protein [Strigomonas culicis]|uniref:Metal binding protein n=1 Tax=Strigomonas culicis TaxID=28005 RepID=S9V2B5_9TRYP|nr:metal binding protein [Strigomonas culicis]EPY37242.1 metal binding protein [Strigomonas culicis]|eukprot:EPY24862.1 metal binding protein [Strigomonas culicis]
MSFRHYPAEYVAKHLHGLTVASSLPAAAGDAPFITTHSGSFHCDEAMACGLLRHTDAYRYANVIRTRDPALIDKGAIVVDVGAVYDPSRHRYDHHQGSFHDTMVVTPEADQSPITTKTFHTRLSSAGLIYRHFGREVIARFVHECVSSSPYSAQLHDELLKWPAEKQHLTPAELDLIYFKMYDSFMEQLDGNDNGVEPYKALLVEEFEEEQKKEEEEEEGVEKDEEEKKERKVPADRKAVLKKNYKVSTTLPARVADMQTWWNQPANAALPPGEDKENEYFGTAVQIASLEFFEKVFFFVFSWLPARGLVEAAYHNRLQVEGGDPEGRIVVLLDYCPWGDHLADIERIDRSAKRRLQRCRGKSTKSVASAPHQDVLYVLYSDGKGWRVQAVRQDGSQFESRKPLPFKGLRDEALSTASGIEGGIFVHVSGFIGGMKTYEGALALAKKAVEMEPAEQ